MLPLNQVALYSVTGRPVMDHGTVGLLSVLSCLGLSKRFPLCSVVYESSFAQYCHTHNICPSALALVLPSLHLRLSSVPLSVPCAFVRACSSLPFV